jgi:hypothetical protein
MQASIHLSVVSIVRPCTSSVIWLDLTLASTGESLADQAVGGLTLSKGERVFVDLAHASNDVRFSMLRM